nr:helix-turn-helix transcriptional regulator [Aquicoccus sp. G2-2]MEA1115016.1 helix-turn-helix transcriptional regulator [Aquicoccus sp. G2-2]
MTPGDKILNACKVRGFSLARACALADLRYSTLHSQIHNQRPIPFTSIDRLATALDVPLDYFSEASSVPPPTQTKTPPPGNPMTHSPTCCRRNSPRRPIWAIKPDSMTCSIG